MIPIHTAEQTSSALQLLVNAGTPEPEPEPVDFAWTAEAYAAAERHAGCRSAVAALVAGNRRLALDIMLTSFTRQLRVHGLGYVALEGRPYAQMGGLPC